MDLYDCPEEIERLINEISDVRLRFFREFNDILQPINPGYSDWSSIYSRKPCYILQCDFSYMISPKMFERFVLPDLKEMCNEIPYAFYHLDGLGQLPHLDFLLGLDKLRGVQWVPGEGNPNQMHWPDVYRKIRGAGRLTQIWSGFDAIDAVADQTGTYKGIQHRIMTVSGEREYEIRKRLGKYGIE